MANDDGDWKPTGRPTSMIARNFSADLNDAFAMDNNNLDGLVQSVQLKKESVDSQTKELQALEARLRDTEERLKERQSRDSSPASRNNGTSSLNRRQPLSNTFNGRENDRLASPVTGPQATSQSVSASTMSHWRPSPNTASGTGNGSASAARVSDQENSHYGK